MTSILGKSFPGVKRNLAGHRGNYFPKPGTRLPGMSTRKRNSLEVLADNLAVWMALPGNEAISTGPKLAAAAKVDRKSVNNVLRKRHFPQLDLVDKLAKALRIDPYLLLAPMEDQQFATVCRAYSVAPESREYLLFSAKAILEKHGRDKTGEANSA
jgi:transcriptional regulator with XRE-family HTH domain